MMEVEAHMEEETLQRQQLRQQQEEKEDEEEIMDVDAHMKMPTANAPQSSFVGQSGAAGAIDAGLCAQCGGRADFRCSICQTVHYL